MEKQLEELKKAFCEDLEHIHKPEDIEPLRIQYLGRKGRLTSILRQMGSLDPSERPRMGGLSNDLKAFMEEALVEKTNALSTEALVQGIDVSLPGRVLRRGSIHILNKVIAEMEGIFRNLGFTIASGPEVEDDYHNFGALNFPPDHPARDMQDTFFLDRTALLRTHTSPVQIRVMKEYPPPVRVIMPGKVYRNEAISSRSYCLFHQIEGLHVDVGVTFSDLKGTLISFIKQFYGSATKYRFRPTFFPFTEPSADIYISCFLCGGKGCRLCKQIGWLEILGCGMVDPNVFTSVGYDPERYTGFAFGMGIERIALLRHGIDDIRLFFENDIRFLNQF